MKPDGHTLHITSTAGFIYASRELCFNSALDYKRMTPEIKAALISALGSILSAIIGSIAAGKIGKRIIKQEKLQKDLQVAVSDIEFLLMVERGHCDENKRQQRQSNFQTIRNRIRRQYSWSGRFTPGRVRGVREL